VGELQKNADTGNSFLGSTDPHHSKSTGGPESDTSNLKYLAIQYPPKDQNSHFKVTCHLLLIIFQTGDLILVKRIILYTKISEFPIQITIRANL
jgi:hypothetical protein